MSLSRHLEQCVSDLVVEEGYRPLSRALPPSEAAEPLFDACLARQDGEDFRVLAVLLWRGQVAEEMASRAAVLRTHLEASSPWVPGRFLVTLLLVTEHDSELSQLADALRGVDPGHFLHKVALGAAAVSQGGRLLEVAKREAPKPALSWLAAEFSRGGRHTREEMETALLRLDAEEKKAGRLLSPTAAPLRATWAITLSLVLVFLWQRDGELLEKGVNQGAKVFGEGEWWRLFSCLFLHADPFHLVMNGLALHSLGGLMERISGPWRMTFVYFAAGLAGSLMSAGLNQESVSLGASGAVLGLAGALLALRFRRPKGFPKVLADRIYGSLNRPILLIFALGFGLMLLGSRVQFDNWAHFGGLAGGFLLALAWPSLLQKPR